MMSIILRKIRENPFYQCAAILFIAFVIGIASSLGGLDTINDKMEPWIMAATGLLFFVVLNTVLGLLSENYGRYYLFSIISFVLYTFLSAMIAFGISGLPIEEAKSMKWIYKIFAVGYVVLLAIIGMIRKIVSYAQKDTSKK